MGILQRTDRGLKEGMRCICTEEDKQALKGVGLVLTWKVVVRYEIVVNGSVLSL
jgi:hypothetical protein